MQNALDLILNELSSADSKHGPMHNSVDGLGTLKCELAELEREVMNAWVENGGGSLIQPEAIQVAAMAIKFLRDICGLELSEGNQPARHMLDETTVESTLSERGRDWLVFSAKVLHHIETYTIAQYGDKGEDRASGYTLPKMAEQIGRYCDRMGTNARGPAEQARDFLKIAHYASLASNL